MLSTIREFALERLRESAEEPDLRRRHAEWFIARLAELVPAWRLDAAAGRMLEPDADNIRSSLDWAEATDDLSLGLRICGYAWRLWLDLASLREGYRRTRALLDADHGTVDRLDRMRALEGAGGMSYYLGDSAAAAAAYRERLSLAEQHAGPAEVADAQFDLSFALGRELDAEGAARAMMAAQAGYAQLGDPIGVARCRWAQSSIVLMQQRVAEARAVLEDIIPVFREHGDFNYLGQALGSLALCELLVGQLEAADQVFTEVVKVGLGRTSLTGLIIGVGSWARVRKLTGHQEEAALLWGAYEGLSSTYGVPMPTQLAALLDRIEANLSIRDELPVAVRESLIVQGRRMSVDDLFEYARTMVPGV
jgi:non-specific serine/threonine protein kinase